jgi:hypothetical protein
MPKRCQNGCRSDVQLLVNNPRQFIVLRHIVEHSQEEERRLCRFSNSFRLKAGDIQELNDPADIGNDKSKTLMPNTSTASEAAGPRFEPVSATPASSRAT